MTDLVSDGVVPGSHRTVVDARVVPSPRGSALSDRRTGPRLYYLKQTKRLHEEACSSISHFPSIDTNFTFKVIFN